MKILLSALCLSFLLGSCVLADMDDVSPDPTSDQALTEDDALAVDEAVSYIGGGECRFGSPDYPACLVEQPDCADYAICYCVCRVAYQCWNDSSQCGPLAQCLSQCDADQPDGGLSCPYPSQPAYPTTISECL
ncbi:hypothetical protein [Haliangium sp.]|uniref:hypothetical protein n=1 Tax=Haliangium sp. TaxID=2663208 RepID=UPI003D13FD43